MKITANGPVLDVDEDEVYDAPVYAEGDPRRMQPTPGSGAGTKIVVLRGGPPQWHGSVCGLSKTGSGRAERWDHTADEIICYLATEESIKVRIIHEKREGPKPQIHEAQVYQYAGYRDELEEVQDEG